MSVDEQPDKEFTNPFFVRFRLCAG